MFPFLPSLRNGELTREEEEEEEDYEEEDDEISEDDFQKMLQRYPKVRNSDYKGESPHSKEENEFDFSSSTDEKSKPTSNKSKEDPPKRGKEELLEETLEEMEDENDPNFFYSHLKKALLNDYDETSSEKVVKQFKKLHEEFIESLSLDDIERLAIQFQSQTV